MRLGNFHYICKLKIKTKMKNTSLIINVILSIAVVVLFILHFTSKPSSGAPATNQSTESGVTASVGDIVYIKLDSLVNNYDMFNDLSSELQSKVQVIQDDLDKKARALENDIQDFSLKVQKGLLTQVAIQQQQNVLAQREQELGEYMQQKRLEMSDEETVMYRKVLDALKTYLEKMNQETGYSMIINTSGSTNNVLHGDSRLDITNAVIKGLNAEYIKQKNTK